MAGGGGSEDRNVMDRCADGTLSSVIEKYLDTECSRVLT